MNRRPLASFASFASFGSPSSIVSPPKLLALILPLVITSAASAAVKHVGTWPENDKAVTLDVHAKGRAEALNQLADAAGWNLVTRDIPDAKANVELHVKQGKAADLLDVLLSDGDYVATRSGNLVALSLGSAVPGTTPADANAAAPVVPATPTVPAIAASPVGPAPLAPLAQLAPGVPLAPAAPALHGKRRGEDRTVTGGKLRVDAGDVVHDVSVLGGALEVFGNVTGDVSVLGGSVHLHKGSHVAGSANVIGGRLDVDDGAEVDGDVGVLGGSVNRAPGSKIHGSVSGIGDDDEHGSGHADEEDDDDGETTHATPADASVKVGDDDKKKNEDHKPRFVARVFETVTDAVSSASLLFVLGALLIALAPRKMDMLRVEAAARPMRAVAIGAVSVVLAAILIVVLCVTILGIPLAVMLACGAPLAMFVGVSAILMTLGAMLIQNRTENPYAHLAVGCVLFLIVGLVPGLGGIAHAVVALAGFGVMVSTRAAGLVPSHAKKGL